MMTREESTLDRRMIAAVMACLLATYGFGCARGAATVAEADEVSVLAASSRGDAEHAIDEWRTFTTDVAVGVVGTTDGAEMFSARAEVHGDRVAFVANDEASESVMWMAADGTISGALSPTSADHLSHFLDDVAPSFGEGIERADSASSSDEALARLMSDYTSSSIYGSEVFMCRIRTAVLAVGIPTVLAALAAGVFAVAKHRTGSARALLDEYAQVISATAGLSLFYTLATEGEYKGSAPIRPSTVIGLLSHRATLLAAVLGPTTARYCGTPPPARITAKARYDGTDVALELRLVSTVSGDLGGYPLLIRGGAFEGHCWGTAWGGGCSDTDFGESWRRVVPLASLGPGFLRGETVVLRGLAVPAAATQGSRVSSGRGGSGGLLQMNVADAISRSRAIGVEHPYTPRTYARVE